jgi:hypothetical protein
MRLLLQILSLSDRYERRAQLLPGLIAASPLALTVAVVARSALTWYEAAGATAAAEFLVAFLLGYLARARGKAAEEVMWKAWGGPPTTRWMRPSDATCSDEQKAKWRGVFHRISGLRIPASASADRTEADVDRVTEDAVRYVRNLLRNHPVAGMVRLHLEEYGFARNLLGLIWHWVGIAAAAVIGCLVLLIAGEKQYVGLAVSGVSLLLSLLVGQQLPDSVKRCADRYAASLLTAAVMYDAGHDPGKAAEPAADGG